MLFYGANGFPVGSLLGTAAAWAQPTGSSYGMPGSDSASQMNPAGVSPTVTISNIVVIGTPALPGGSGAPIPAVDHVSVSETAQVVAGIVAPASPSQNSQAIELVVAHSSIDAVQADDQGVYSINGSPPEAKASSTFSTNSPYHFDIANSAGGSPFGTVTYSFTLDLQEPHPKFGHQTTLHIQAAHFRVDLSVTQLEIRGTIGGSSAILYSAPYFPYGHVSITHTVPVFAHESISASSHYTTYGLGPFHDELAVNYGDFSYSLVVTLN